MSAEVLFWTARDTSGNRWQFEDGWSSELDAHRCAKWYRENYRRRCVVVPVPKDATTAERCDLLRQLLAGTTPDSV